MRLLSVALLLSLVSACSSQPTSPSLPAPDHGAPLKSEALRWAERVARLKTLEQWQVRGKVAYRLPSDAGSATLNWQQDGIMSELRLSGPLGVGSTQITSDGNHANALLRVERNGIARLYSADAAPWLPDGSLLPVPVQAIQHWLRGVPDPSQQVLTLTRDNALATRIEQGGWVIEYGDYRSDEALGLPMPQRLTLEQAESGLSLRLILRDWTLIATR